MTDTLTGTVTFQRKVNPAQYQATEAGHFVQYEVDPNASDDAIKAEAKRVFALCKSVVLDELGISYTVDPQTGIVHEGGVAGLQAAGMTPETQTQTAPPAPPAPPTQTAVGTADGAGPNPPQKTGNRDADDKAMAAWATVRFATNPDEFYDNRPKKASGEYKPRSPDLKHKPTQTGIWL